MAEFSEQASKLKRGKNRKIVTVAALILFALYGVIITIYRTQNGRQHIRLSGTLILVRIGEKAMIPKIIHYCWFGGKELLIEVKKCIASWRKMCPDYEIIRWDESNFDVGQHPL